MEAATRPYSVGPDVRRLWWSWATLTAASTCAAASSFYWAIEIDVTYYIAVYAGLAVLWRLGLVARCEASDMPRRLDRAGLMAIAYIPVVMVPVYLWNRSVLDPDDVIEHGAWLATLLLILAAGWYRAHAWRRG